MKKLLSVSLAFVVFLTLLLSSCVKGDFYDVTYKVRLHTDCGFVYFPESDTAHYFADEDTRIYPASTTKLLTILAALDIMPPDELVEPGDEVYLPETGSSSAYIRPNHMLTVEMLVEGMLLPSGNDAAYALSAACGCVLLDDSEAKYTDAVEKFTDYMNEYAIKLGCTGTNFTAPDGFAGREHYSTLRDMLLISKAAAENEIITKYSAMPYDDVVYASGHTNTWTNTNKLLDENSKYYCKGVVGLKTGSLEDNYSLIVLYDDGETRFVIGLFGEKTDDDRYTDALNLIQCVIDNYN